MFGQHHNTELRRLAVLLNTLRRGGLAVALCDDESIQVHLANELRTRLSRRVHMFSLSPGAQLPLRQMAEASVLPGDVVMFFGFPQEEENPGARDILSQLEFERETFWNTGANFLFWVTSFGQRLLLRAAPNFYSRRTGLLPINRYK